MPTDTRKQSWRLASEEHRDPRLGRHELNGESASMGTLSNEWSGGVNGERSLQIIHGFNARRAYRSSDIARKDRLGISTVRVQVRRELLFEFVSAFGRLFLEYNLCRANSEEGMGAASW